MHHPVIPSLGFYLNYLLNYISLYNHLILYKLKYTSIILVFSYINAVIKYLIKKEQQN